MHAVNINRVVVSGSLAREPRLHRLPRGESVCNLLVACQTPDRVACEQTHAQKLNYFDVKVYGEQAEQASRQMHRGEGLIVEGRLDWREWETVEGHCAHTVSILAETLASLEDTQAAEDQATMFRRRMAFGPGHETSRGSFAI
jgi:single-strand DNA-binding protein